MIPANKTIIIPIHSLQQAENYFPETVEIIATYLECAKTNNFGPFYDELIDVIEGSREDVVVTDSNGEKVINNFQQVWDDLAMAVEIIKPFLEKEEYIPDEYETEYSYRLDDQSVAVRLRALK